ncbi:MAG: L-threonylcarbamoyladenylate synthase [Actinomycetota bacterium]
MEPQLEEAVRALRRGGLVVIPTDTVYGLAAPAGDADAARRIFALKGRDEGKPLQILIPDARSMSELARPSRSAVLLAERFWPGPLTLVVPAKAGGTVGLRVPGHPLALELLAATGPVSATSANRSGEPTPADIGSIRTHFGAAVDVYVDGGHVDGLPSTVVDVTGPGVVVLREGAVPRADIEGAAGGPIGAR